MCILCVIQKWSRRVATMLPWLVIPMIGLWAVSQLLPPAFRFEITSPRVACVLVLLFTLFWYEILMPYLSSWRIKRNARMRERKRSEAIEMQKLRKTAMRRCRNCLTPYRDQNPGGGKFMCSYCGHVSKRPVLDLPVPPGLSSSGILKDLVGKGGKLFNGNNRWICSQVCLENGNWVGKPLSGACQKNGSEFYSNEELCISGESYSLNLHQIISYACFNIRMVWRKITRGSPNGDEGSFDAEQRRILAKRDDNVGNESRGEKARRKAEEKRQARIERELLEEEERKQREEVARLVEERRKLRDEIMIAEKDSCRSVSASKEKKRKKEADRKRQERRKEKDKGSSKSNSDVEEFEKRAVKDNDRKRELDKKSESDRRENFRVNVDAAKNRSIGTAHEPKNVVTHNYNRGSAGTRYLDRMKGTFFGRGTNTSAAVSRENKPNTSIDTLHHSANMREFSRPVKSSMNGEDKAVCRPVSIEPQPPAAPKKTWGQLFSRSPAAPSVINSNVIGRPKGNSQVEARSPPLVGHSSSVHVYDNPINFGLPSPFSCAPTSSCTVPPLTSEAMFPRIGEMPCDMSSEEYESFEEPCYVPDPVSLLGPVLESLDDFQLDLGPGFATEIGLERPGGLKKISTAEVNKPSPIESPISRTRISDEKHSNLNRLPTPKAQDVHSLPLNNSYGANQNGAWQMWNSSPLGQDGLGFIGGGPASWMLPPELNRLNKDDIAHPIGQNTAVSLFSTDNQTFSCAHSPRKVYPGNGHNVGSFATPIPGSTGDPWLPTNLFAQIPCTDDPFSTNPLEDSYGTPNSSATDHSFEFPHANSWAKNDRANAVESTGSSSSIKQPHIGGLYSTPDVQSLWSYD